MLIPNDAYGRTITFSTNGIEDTYVIDNGQGGVYISVPAGKPQEAVYNTINAMLFAPQVAEENNEQNQ